eukprot:SAG11_NODE_915_length_6553_cov_6.900728_3_plen_284_part_00
MWFLGVCRHERRIFFSRLAATAMVPRITSVLKRSGFACGYSACMCVATIDSNNDNDDLEGGAHSQHFPREAGVNLPLLALHHGKIQTHFLLYYIINFHLSWRNSDAFSFILYHSFSFIMAKFRRIFFYSVMIYAHASTRHHRNVPTWSKSGDCVDLSAPSKCVDPCGEQALFLKFWHCGSMYIYHHYLQRSRRASSRVLVRLLTRFAHVFSSVPPHRHGLCSDRRRDGTAKVVAEMRRRKDELLLEVQTNVRCSSLYTIARSNGNIVVIALISSTWSADAAAC